MRPVNLEDEPLMESVSTRIKNAKINMHNNLCNIRDRCAMNSILKKYVVLGGNTNPKSEWLKFRRIMALAFLVVFVILFALSDSVISLAFSLSIFFMLLSYDFVDLAIRYKCCRDAKMKRWESLTFSFPKTIRNLHYDADGQIVRTF